jgi:hypothetical protein
MLTRPTFAVNNIQSLEDIVQNKKTELKVLLDKVGADIKAYLISLLDEIDLDLATKEEVAGIVLGQILDGSLGDDKLSYADGQIKERFATHLVAYAAFVATKGVSNGLATLDETGKLTESQGSGTWVKIAEQILSTTAASVSFSSIPSGYKNFKLIIDGISSTTSSSFVKLTFNDDGGSNYRNTSVTATYADIYYVLTRSDYMPSFSVVDISNFNPLKQKRLRSTVLHQDTATTQTIMDMNSTWLNTTSEINKITLTSDPSLIGIGSRFVLWGCK